MANKIFALLAGVIDYTPNVGKLRGCLNDVDHYREYLQRNFPASSLAIEVLKDSQATRQGIIDGFRNHLSQAGSNDVVLFQFAGHGARWKAAKEFHSIYPDGYDEGLVCWDSRREPDKPGSYDLADKELAVLVSEVSGKGQHVVVILDCCHSGSGTRSAEAFCDVTPRMSHQIDAERPLNSYLDGYYSKRLETGHTLMTPTSRHILLAACERKKQAFENNEERGFFSSTLLDTLEELQGQATYADMFVRIRAIVKRLAVQQTPQFETYLGFNGRSGFLGLPTQSRSGKARFHVSYDLPKGEWVVECGALQGLQSSVNQIPEFTLYSKMADTEAVGTATPKMIGLGHTQVELDFESSKRKDYLAEVSSLPTAPMFFALRGLDQGKALLKDRLQADDRFASVSLEEDESLNLEYAVTAVDDQTEGPCFLLTEAASGRLLYGVRTLNQLAAEQMLSVLDQVANWHRLVELQNPHNQTGFDQVPFELVEVKNGQDVPHPGNQLRFDFSGNGDDDVVAKLVTRNQTGQALYSILLYFDDQFGLTVMDKDEFPAVEGTRTLLLGGKPEFDIYVDSESPNFSIDRFMLVVSSEPIDDFLLGPLYLQSDSGDGQVFKSLPIGKIVDARQGRKVRTHAQRVKKVDWFTKTIEIALHKQSGKLGSEDAVLANDRIRVKGHPQLKANLTLSGTGASALSARSADSDQSFGTDQMHTAFHQALEANGITPVNLANARGETISTLELTDIENASALQETPLEIEVDTRLQPDEFLLPLTFDGEHILLAGETTTSEQGTSLVSITDVPTSVHNQRSVFTSLKLYFFKAYFNSQQVNSLYWVDYSDSTPILRADGVPSKIAKAKRVVLLIHGLLGNATSMAAQFAPRQHPEMYRTADPSSAEFDKETVVLAYQFESLNTKLEETAKDLQQQLTSVGIGPEDGKSMAIIANSSGGLVARWLIEQLDGQSMVDHAVLCGTPNGGSPIGKIGLAKTLAKTLTTLALNFFPGVATIGGYLASYLIKADGLTVTLEQLDSQGELLTKLNASDDPGVKYSLVAGDANQIQTTQGWKDSLIKKLGTSGALGMVFGNSPHDVLVSTASSQHVNRSRSPAPVDLEVPEHHFGYGVSKLDIQLFDS